MRRRDNSRPGRRHAHHDQLSSNSFMTLALDERLGNLIDNMIAVNSDEPERPSREAQVPRPPRDEAKEQEEQEHEGPSGTTIYYKNQSGHYEPTDQEDPARRNEVFIRITNEPNDAKNTPNQPSTSRSRR